MNQDKEQLLADHFSGNDVNQELLKALEDDQELLNELAELTVVDRALSLTNQNEDKFLDELTERLSLENDENFVNELKGKLEQEKVKPFKQWIWLASAACLMLIPALFYTFKTETNMANVVSSINAEWDNDIQNGITQGKLTLKSGYAKLAMKNGTTLLLEGPTEIDIKSKENVLVHNGSLVANIPEEVENFKISTTTLQLENQHQEFALKVDKKGNSEVHAFSGDLKVSANTEQINIPQGQARYIDEFQQMTKLMSNPTVFMRSLPNKSDHRPDYLHWSFDHISSKIICEGPGIDSKIYHGEYGGQNPQTTNGQFNQALEFNGTDSYVSTDFKGIDGSKPRTVAFWVKVPKDFNVNNGYGIVSWGQMKKGQAWQISPNPTSKDGPIGRLRVGTHLGMVIGTTDLRDGLWHHVAVVMYGGDEAKSSTHILIFIDGQLERTSKKSVALINTKTDRSKSKSLAIGRNLGYSANSKNKYFKGSIDEVFIFDSALNEEQIRSIMNTNKLPVKGEL